MRQDLVILYDGRGRSLSRRMLSLRIREGQQLRMAHFVTIHWRRMHSNDVCSVDLGEL